MTKRIHIIAPPPTPNGDLHVGHMSGPYMAADMFRRYLAQQGVETNYAVSTDDHQSYVDTTAARLGLDRDRLVARSRDEISRTMRTYGVGVRELGAIDERYCQFVTGFFERLFQAGWVTVQPQPVLFDVRSGSYPVEAFVSGTCPACLADAAGGICEACGHPNACVDLVGLDTARYKVRNEPRLALDLERLRPELTEALRRMTHRPALQRLIDELLAKPLPPFVLSYCTPRGISAGFAGLPEQKLNVWGEMYPGHIYFLEQAGGAPVAAQDTYVQFLGFDNSYFYVFVHMALHLAGRACGFEWPTPKAFVTNQFYNLESDKFSTSKGHLVWARDLARDFNADVIRLYLALNGPEYQEASFVPGVFRLAAAELVARVNGAVDAFNAAEFCTDAGPLPQHLTAPWSETLTLEHYSASVLARRAMNLVQRISRALTAGDRGLSPYVPGMLVLALEVFCPHWTESIRERFAITARGWDELRPARLHQLLPALRVLPA